MELQYLKYFSAVAETLNFSEAAKRCHVSQPALSAQVRILEDRLGTQLFHRNRRSVTLTKEGHALIPRVRRILMDLDELSGAAKELQEPLAGNFFVGVTPLIPLSNAFTTLNQMQKDHPRLKLSFLEEGAAPLIGKLLAHQLDLILIPHHARLESPLIDFRVIDTVPVALCFPGWGTNPGLPFIRINSVCGLREYVDQSMKELDRKASGSLEAAHLPMIKEWIRLGLGWSILPEKCLSPEERLTLDVRRPKGLKPIQVCAAMLRGQRAITCLKNFSSKPSS
ncbi:MAG: LysR family transcriptional regulator [Deltaproteobacteria bacterium]|nr:LysR family transcriptional regulator [Deltaproteobacteria bacterium]